MVRAAGLLGAAFLVSLFPVQDRARTKVGDGPTYTADGKLRFPEKYREWVFLTSGFNMSYNPKAKDAGDGMFDNVFVNPEAYRSYQQTGHWPEGTELVLENRGAEAGKSINKAGKTQSPEVMGTEVHVLDAAHADAKSNGWSFYGFDGKPAERIPRTADCYSCHEQHAAVDTTFVQFYPTLYAAADKNKTLSPAFLKEMSAR